MKYFGSWQLNVSTPLVAELYTAFSIWGVILGFLLLGKMIYKIDQWSYSYEPIKNIAVLFVYWNDYIYFTRVITCFSGFHRGISCINVFYFFCVQNI